VNFPVKLNDSYTCQARDADGVSVAFDDLLDVGDEVAHHSDNQGNCYPPMGTVVRREDGLWIELKVDGFPSAEAIEAVARHRAMKELYGHWDDFHTPMGLGRARARLDQLFERSPAVRSSWLIAAERDLTIAVIRDWRAQ